MMGDQMADIHSAIRASVDHWILYRTLLPDSLKSVNFDTWTDATIEALYRDRHFEYFNNLEQEIWIDGSYIYLDIQFQFDPKLVPDDSSADKIYQKLQTDPHPDELEVNVSWTDDTDHLVVLKFDQIGINDAKHTE